MLLYFYSVLFRHLILKSARKILIYGLSHDLQPLIDYGGHLGRHFENNGFAIVRCRYIFIVYVLCHKLLKSAGKYLFIVFPTTQGH